MSRKIIYPWVWTAIVPTAFAAYVPGYVLLVWAWQRHVCYSGVAADTALSGTRVALDPDWATFQRTLQYKKIKILRVRVFHYFCRTHARLGRNHYEGVASKVNVLPMKRTWLARRNCLQKSWSACWRITKNWRLPWWRSKRSLQHAGNKPKLCSYIILQQEQSLLPRFLRKSLTP